MTDTLYKLKEKLRKQVLDARFKLSPEERKAKSRTIEDRLFSLPEFRAASTILFFASFRSEVESEAMIRRAVTTLARQPSLRRLPLLEQGLELLARVAERELERARNGIETSFYDALQDSHIAPVLSREGVTQDPWGLMHPRAWEPGPAPADPFTVARIR